MTEKIDAGGLSIDPDEMEEILAAQTVPKSKRKQPHRAVQYIGAPMSFVKDVCLLTEGRAALVVALCIYRRTRVCGSRTVTLPTTELAEFDIDRSRKRDALARLQRAGLIKVGNMPGHTARITLIRQPSSKTDRALGSTVGVRWRIRKRAL
jgi:hypothetical protein